MAARSIASLSLSFGLVSIPVRLYSATETAASVKFNLLTKDGSRVKQQYVSEKDQAVVARADMVKRYEVEKDKFVLFSAEELKKPPRNSRSSRKVAATSSKSSLSFSRNRWTPTTMTRPICSHRTNAVGSPMRC